MGMGQEIDRRANGADRDEEVVSVIGAGLAGLATALGVAARGRKVTLFEAADQVGGAAAYSGGQAWFGANHVEAREGIEDSLEEVERYVRAIAADHPEALDEVAMKRWIEAAPAAARHWEDLGAVRWIVIPGLADYHGYAEGAHGPGRYLTNEVIDGAELGDWRAKLRVSPYFPVGTTYAEMFDRGRREAFVGDEKREGVAEHAGVPAFGLPEGRQTVVAERASDPLTFGTGVVAGFLARATREPRLEILLEHRVDRLLTAEDGRVTGALATGPDGTVERRGPVVLATSSYDWDPELVEELLGLGPDDFGSVAPRSLRGDAIKLARSVGGAVAQIPATSVPMLPGWLNPSGLYAYGPEYALPHSMIVDASGQRYCDDSYWVDIVRRTLDPDDRHLPFFLIWDEQHHRKYGLSAVGPGEAYPNELVTSASTLAEVGAALGIDGAALTATAQRFSEHAIGGEDPDFGRGTVEYIRRFTGDPHQSPNPVLGPVVEPPFHGLRLKFVGTGVGSSGVHIDGDGRVLDESGEPLSGLYAVGSCAALTAAGSGYNSGFALGRGLTLAYLVAAELTDQP